MDPIALIKPGSAIAPIQSHDFRAGLGLPTERKFVSDPTFSSLFSSLF